LNTTLVSIGIVIIAFGFVLTVVRVLHRNDGVLLGLFGLMIALIGFDPIHNDIALYPLCFASGAFFGILSKRWVPTFSLLIALAAAFLTLMFALFRRGFA